MDSNTSTPSATESGNETPKKWWKLPKFAYALIGIFIVAILGTGGYLMFAPKTGTGTPEPIPPVDTVSTSAQTSDEAEDLLEEEEEVESELSGTPTPIASTLTFTNAQFGYSIKYPSNWVASNAGALEPKVPSYIKFNPKTKLGEPVAAIRVSSSTRTYNEMLQITGSQGQPITLAGFNGLKLNIKDSNGLQSVYIVLNSQPYVYILVTKKEYEGVFSDMYKTFTKI